jgi:Aminoglycoside 3-N-acetyltransferase
LDIDLKKFKAPYLVHTDILHSFGLIKEKFQKYGRSVAPSQLHFDLLAATFGKDNLIFPSFNYSFASDKIFDLRRSPSHVGEITNYLISNSIFGRTRTPIFSFLTDIKDLLSGSRFPFSKGSVFDYLYSNDGTIIFYGTDISSCTYLHYVEDQYGPPLFRYDKIFEGVLLDEEESVEKAVEFHVRPLGLGLGYNWGLLFGLLMESQVVHRIAPSVFAVSCRDISQIWGSFYSNDQCLILSESVIDPVREKLKILGRRFLQSDFEVSI